MDYAFAKVRLLNTPYVLKRFMFKKIVEKNTNFNFSMHYLRLNCRL